jgi:hypothetical protein
VGGGAPHILEITAVRKGHRYRVHEDKVLKKIFGTKRKEEVGKWRNMHTEELRNLYSSPNIIN